VITEQEIAKRLLITRDAMETHSQKRAADLAQAASMVVETYRAGGKVLIFGNGGSAAEAQHIAAELVNRMKFDREPLAAVALTTDSSVMTSIANDYEFREVFAKQVRALGRPGDLAWGLSTSGASPNVILALQAAGKIGMKRMAMAGRPGAKIQEAAEHCLWVDSDSTPVVQEVHLAAAHIICELVERELFGGKNG
jgi:D-sedoheptulose 7-phosphate isomerase